MSSTTFPLSLLLGTPATGGTKLTGVTTGTGNWQQITGGPQDLTFTFTSVGTTSGGTVVLEETDSIDDPSGATPSTLYSQAASGFTGTAKLCYHVRIGAGIYVRARISSAITGGGNIFVTMVGS